MLNTPKKNLMEDHETRSADPFGFEPLASKMIAFEKFDAKRFEAAYGAGESDDEKAFATRFAYALGMRAIRALEALGESQLGSVGFDKVVGR